VGCCFSTNQAEPRLKSSASAQEIVEAMAHQGTGVGFLTQHPSLPTHTFVSADAVTWLISHVEGVLCEQDAVSLLKVSSPSGHRCSKKRNSVILTAFQQALTKYEKSMLLIALILCLMTLISPELPADCKNL